MGSLASGNISGFFFYCVRCSQDIQIVDKGFPVLDFVPAIAYHCS